MRQRRHTFRLAIDARSLDDCRARPGLARIIPPALPHHVSDVEAGTTAQWPENGLNSPFEKATLAA